ncbi:MAG: hypothetical protein IPM14_02815 [bacterium]|nr:hypothetical protein [bacterium]
MRLNQIALIVIIFIIVSFLLTIFGVLPVTLIDILSYSLLIIGMALVYSEGIRQNGLSVFLGSVIFLIGVYALISENFTLNINKEISVPIILIISGSGLLILHIITSTRIIFLLVSIACLSSGMTLLILDSRWSISTFIHSVIPVLNYLWPIIIILAVFILLLRK